eukprot:FR739519.1.p1 GENE.FR739519.1~~FR739519.1.p1  ORF type:complete len:124 (+),score=4.44 FR739519.1:530-901(+)
MVIAVSWVKLLSAHNSAQHTSRKHKVESLGCLMSELTHINCVALTARFPVGKPVVPAALMNRPTRGERRFAVLGALPVPRSLNPCARSFGWGKRYPLPPRGKYGLSPRTRGKRPEKTGGAKGP